VKKTIVAIFAFVMGLMMWPAEEVKAYPGGLLNEKEITYQSGLNSYEQTMFVTDNDIETYVNIGSTNRVYYDFAEPVVLDGYYFYIVRAGGGATGATLRYYNEEGDQLFIDTVNKPPAQESGEETFRKHTPVNGVKRVEVKRFQSTTLYLAEFDVFEYIDTEPPGIPENLWVESVPNGAYLHWEPVKDDDLRGYYIYQDGVKVNTTPINDNEYVVIGLTEGMRYTFYVTAVDYSGNESDPSNEVSYIQLDLVPPSAPKGIEVIAENNQAILSWDAVGDADLEGYNIYVDGNRINTTPIQSTTYTIKNLVNDQFYTFYVTAVDYSGNESDPSESIRVKVLDTIPPAQPQNVTAVAGNESATIMWSANTETDLDGYYLYMDGIKINVRPIDAVFYQVTGLDNGRTYVFTLTAVDTSGNESIPSLPVEVEPDIKADIEPPATPSDVQALATENSITVSWAANTESDLLGYFVYLDGRRVNYSPISETEYVIPNLIAGESYIVQVTAIDQGGNESEKSEPIEITPIDTTPPAAPIALTARAGDTQVHLSWMPNTEKDLAGYNVYIDGTKKNSQLIKSNKYDARGLINGETYTFYVTAVDYSGNESEPSNEVQSKPFNQTPNVIVQPTPQYLNVTWEPIEEAIGYELYYNNKKIKDFGPDTFEYKITVDDGYNPNSVFHNVKVIAVFRDGSTSSPPPDAGNRPNGWGFVAKDIFTNALWIVANVAGFILLGLVFAHANKIIDLIKQVINKARGRVRHGRG